MCDQEHFIVFLSTSVSDSFCVKPSFFMYILKETFSFQKRFGEASVKEYWGTISLQTKIFNTYKIWNSGFDAIYIDIFILVNS